jgi:hypothetical protein
MRTILLVLWVGAIGHAQSISPQLALARICASEEGLERLTDGCAAIHTVLLRGAARNRMSYVAYAQAYSPGVFDGSRRRAWLADLLPDGSQPMRWPAFVTRRVGDHVEVRRGAPWSLYRERWLDLYRHAGMIIRGEIHDLCEIEPHDWGCPPDPHNVCMDHENATAHGLELVRCGDTNNEFWIRPWLLE